LPRALPARYVPPSGFGYPLDGFLPSAPCRFCFTPAALLGFTLRSFPLSKGIRCVTAPNAPTYRSACRCSRRLPDRPARQAAVPGFPPFRESLASGRVFSTPSAGCSLGFRPSRVLHGSLDRDFARPPLTRFADPTQATDPPAPQSVDRPPPHLVRVPH
jgi:hypothetical protein